MVVYVVWGEQVEDVYCFVGGDGFVDCVGDYWVFEEFVVVDGFGDVGEVLVYYVVCVEVYVVDFGIVYLVVGQVDVYVGVGDQVVWLGCQEVILDWFFCGVDGVVVRVFVVVEVVQDDQDQGFGCGSYMFGFIFVGFRN